MGDHLPPRWEMKGIHVLWTSHTCANYRFSQNTIGNVKLFDKWLHLFRGLRGQGRIAQDSEGWPLHRRRKAAAERGGRAGGSNGCTNTEWGCRATIPGQDQTQNHGSDQTQSSSRPARPQWRGRSQAKPRSQTSEAQSGLGGQTRHSRNFTVARRGPAVQPRFVCSSQGKEELALNSSCLHSSSCQWRSWPQAAPAELGYLLEVRTSPWGYLQGPWIFLEKNSQEIALV